MANPQSIRIQWRHQARHWLGLFIVLCGAFVHSVFGAAPAAATNAVPAELVIPKSNFLDDVKDRNARDPFFPLSTRRKTEEEAIQASSVTPTAKTASAEQFVVKSILGKSRKIAVINNTIFEVGKELPVVSTEGISHSVKCWEIRPTSVIISIDRRPERSEIHLKSTSSLNLQK